VFQKSYGLVNSPTAFFIHFMHVIKPLVQKAAELGIVNVDTMEFTGFQAVISSYPDNVQFHATTILVINEWLRRTSQSVSDIFKIELALFVLNSILDGHLKFLEVQHSSLIEELKRKGWLSEKHDN